MRRLSRLPKLADEKTPIFSFRETPTMAERFWARAGAVAMLLGIPNPHLLELVRSKALTGRVDDEGELWIGAESIDQHLALQQASERALESSRWILRSEFAS